MDEGEPEMDYKHRSKMGLGHTHRSQRPHPPLTNYSTIQTMHTCAASLDHLVTKPTFVEANPCRSLPVNHLTSFICSLLICILFSLVLLDPDMSHCNYDFQLTPPIYKCFALPHQSSPVSTPTYYPELPCRHSPAPSERSPSPTHPMGSCWCHLLDSNCPKTPHT